MKPTLSLSYTHTHTRAKVRKYARNKSIPGGQPSKFHPTPKKKKKKSYLRLQTNDARPRDDAFPTEMEKRMYDITQILGYVPLCRRWAYIKKSRVTS